MIKMRHSKKYGRGIYATQDIRSGKTIFSDQLLVIPKKDVSKVKDSILECYWFDFDKINYAIALGLGSLFNHHDEENVVAIINEKSKIIEFKTLRNIKKGEQLFLNYGYNPI